MINRTELKNNWSVFLDRDGVINKPFPGGYVRKPSEFTFLPGSLFAFNLLSNIFKNIFIVTNQQGIGKGIMTIRELEDIHRQMLGKIKENGGRIDRIFFCPDLASKKPNCRKPGLAMAQMVKKEFPAIDFRKSYMVGDSLSDMEFGKNAEMQCVFIRSNDNDETNVSNIPVYSSLLEFARTL
ncbi:MAG: HAD-IIIA family hydrolase [Bacteroidales bacterium]|jgi:histidinol-phosphate phosphatase family protein|nr:HAD-IIIA family hydrolase [Bacteroidales bacterium]